MPGVDCVYADDEAGAAAATGYLLDLGHRRIAHITGIEYEGYERRRRAYEAAMANAGIFRKPLLRTATAGCCRANRQGPWIRPTARRLCSRTTTRWRSASAKRRTRLVSAFETFVADRLR